MPYYNRDPKRDHNFDNHSYRVIEIMDKKMEATNLGFREGVWGLGFRT